MAKKLNKLITRVSALEKTIADFLAGNTIAPKNKKKASAKAKKAKRESAKKTLRKAIKKTTKAAKKAMPKKPPRKIPKKTAKKVAVALAAGKKAAARPNVPKLEKPARKKRVHIRPPTIEQLAPSGAPNFVQPLDKV